MQRPLIIIPARGGSKGIPRKNIRLLDGKPLIAYSIEVARAVTPAPENIILSTDDDEIARVAREWGIETPYMRPAELGGDCVGTREVLLHAMDWADSRGITYDCVLLLQPTSPLRAVADVEKALNLYRHDIDMVVSVMPAAANPYYDCFETDADGFLNISKGPGTYTRRQDAPEAWQYNGAVYVINPESLRRTPMGCFRRRIPLVMPRENSIDLDTPLDWTIAEAIINARK